MTIFADPKKLKQLREAADKNDEAGDWVSTVLPDGTVADEKAVEDILKRVGGVRLPTKK